MIDLSNKYVLLYFKYYKFHISYPIKNNPIKLIIIISNNNFWIK